MEILLKLSGVGFVDINYWDYTVEVYDKKGWSITVLQFGTKNKNFKKIVKQVKAIGLVNEEVYPNGIRYMNGKLEENTMQYGVSQEYQAQN